MPAPEKIMEATRSGRLGTVGDWMSKRPVTVSGERPVGDVVRLMQSQGIRHVLVLDEGCLAGILSNRDVGRLVVAGAHTLSPAIPVKQVMTENPVIVSPELPLTEAAREMLDRKIGALPVVVDGAPIGILTSSDVLEALLRWAEGERIGTRREEA